jgi:hypothetical protein
LWRRTKAWGAAALTVYFALIVVVLMNVAFSSVITPSNGPYESIAIELAIAAGGADPLRRQRRYRRRLGVAPSHTWAK